MKSILKRLTAGVLAVALLAGCAAGEEWTRVSDLLYGHLRYGGHHHRLHQDRRGLDRYADRAHELLLYYNQLFDRYNSYEGLNNVKTINDNAGIAPVQVDEPLLDLLELCKEWYADSQGTVNVCLGPVLEIWHNYRERYAGEENGELPPMEELQAAAAHTDIDKLIIDREAGTVYLEEPEMSLDLGAGGQGLCHRAGLPAALCRGLHLLCDELRRQCPGDGRPGGRLPDRLGCRPAGPGRRDGGWGLGGCGYRQ